ncbi:SDR family NAD(P)-dependent oxidoreductase [Pseudoclavibacter sp. CFCC 13611]|uniref:SDR family NAD(P)-dependent oxidoreductase n=1 Tax=Pseudoclavibacter sp. CFCC 13611 TaxID=2615178 RepID=UPI00130140D1|nr:SDR family NAD(P)-dependent oxidoreductase [Pseudoclavibacter sp. CFCC 13611]KAB1663906.1 SDR family NAD(P)-dependent oxidoreductase [Pseudoclavibacter sp. CFCC 13611]
MSAPAADGAAGLRSEARVAMVTGATRGIGLAAARLLAARGWALSLGVRDVDRVPPDLRDLDDRRILTDHYDADDLATPASWRAATRARFGRIDALVHCAGISGDDPFDTVDASALERVWRINTLAPTVLAQTVLPDLRRSGSGRILLTASMSGRRVRNDHIAYTESKFAVMGLAHTLRREAWDDGVRVCALCPSFVRTDMTSGVTKVDPSEMTPPETIAELIATVIELPNTASIAELAVNCRLEDTV